MYVSVWGFIHMSACTLGGQKRALGPSEMELQVVELLVIGSELGSSARPVYT